MFLSIRFDENITRGRSCLDKSSCWSIHREIEGCFLVGWWNDWSSSKQMMNILNKFELTRDNSLKNFLTLSLYLLLSTHQRNEFIISCNFIELLAFFSSWTDGYYPHYYQINFTNHHEYTLGKKEVFSSHTLDRCYIYICMSKSDDFSICIIGKHANLTVQTFLRPYVRLRWHFSDKSNRFLSIQLLASYLCRLWIRD